MDWLNYHHLLYFSVVAREGTIARACDQLHLTQPSISKQLRQLEHSVGEKLFKRVGRNLVLTETGQLVFRDADEIFSLGRELSEALRGKPSRERLRLLVGVADVVPKLIAYRVLEPAWHLREPVQLMCDERCLVDLLAELAEHRLDLVLSDSPLSPTARVRVADGEPRQPDSRFAVSHRSTSGVLGLKHLNDSPSFPFKWCNNQRTLHHSPLKPPPLFGDGGGRSECRAFSA